MASVDGGHLLAQALAAENIRCVFTVSGGGLNSFYNACPQYGIRVIHTRHEYGAAFMADGWARATGEPGVCVVTLGPGLTNAVTGMLSSYMAAVPMVVLSCAAPVSKWDMGTPQSFEHLPFVRPVTKWARTVYETSRVAEYASTAFRHARSGRPGPVFLDFPVDVLNGKLDEDRVLPPRGYRTNSRPMADPSQVTDTLALLRSAERPMIVCGSGIWWSQASEELTAFVEASGTPVFCGRNGRGSVPADHPLSFGIASVPVNDVFLKAAGDCDLVIMVGGRFDSMLGFGRPPIFNPDSRAVQIDIEPEEIGRNRPIDVGIVADARTALRQLLQELPSEASPDRTEWVNNLRAERKRVVGERAASETSDDAPVHPLRLVKEIREFLDRDAIIAVGSGDIDFWGEHYFEPYRPGCYLRSGQVGALGSDIPYAVAAKLAHPNRQVLVLLGDGGFGYSAMELETAARYGAAVVCVIGNDSSWGMIKHQQEHAYGREGVVGTELLDRPYEKVVEALGGYGERVREPGQIRPALERAFAAGVPACLNVTMQSVPSPELSWMLNPKK